MHDYYAVSFKTVVFKETVFNCCKTLCLKNVHVVHVFVPRKCRFLTHRRDAKPPQRRFRRRATPAKRGIGPGCVPQEVGGLAGRLRTASRACQAQMHVTRPKKFWAPGLEVKQAGPQAGEGMEAKQARPQEREGLEVKQARPPAR